LLIEPTLGKTKKILLIIELLTLFPLISTYPQYPRIRSFSRRDPLFVQLQESLSQFYRWKSKRTTRGKPTHISIYEYRIKKGDDLFVIAAKANLPYDTISSLNRINNPGEIKDRKILYIPTLPGIFVPVKPRSTLEIIMLSWRRNKRKEDLLITLKTPKGRVKFYFYMDDRFHPIERAYFLRILFRFPLPKGVISSGYGKRINPFTGHEEFHSGIDIAAPIGTPVMAARDGRVIYTGYNSIYGKHIIIEHSGGYETIYGHLSEIDVRLHNYVSSGMIIGKVGMTGMATGPHLHFEIRRKGQPTNPIPLLLGVKRKR